VASSDAVALLPYEALVKTSALDQAAWCYSAGILSYLQRKRFTLAAELLGTKYGSLLEVGYGSGIFLPTLAGRCERLCGVDVHPNAQAVTEKLAGCGVRAELVRAPAEELPYDDAAFDAVVSVSALEFVDDIDQACRELARVLRPGGVGVFITPGFSSVLDLGLFVLTGERAEDTFLGRRQGVLPALDRHFRIVRAVHFPRVARLWLYTGVQASRC
jgi:ubiquinone/menaquinone biosynthesis C-methylase UbiE